MNNRFFNLLYLSLIILLVPLQQGFSDDRLSSIINGVRERYGNTSALCADYTREAISKTMAMLKVADRHELAKGKIFFKPPHFFRLEQSSPQVELLVTNGQALWWYIPSKKEAYRYPFEKFDKELRLLSDILKGLKDIKDTYEITININHDAKTSSLILTPRQISQELEKLEVTISDDDYGIKVVNIYNKIGGVTTFVFSNWKQTDRFQEGFFSFSPSQDIKIIEQ